ncbi:uncharacterized protein MELLADRAFT_101054 [Melampsora larici-populina 98AG31]|uniref:Secreted protein n=1 Tax=Melampsora larici-populina (strain 98AG31 / pathotype 3-4-7) TaxID=747676 RepID=F4R3H0_MELLP|nr:uncharacterized protein MELLADRAFT_101054 [Melampsora larici-populina 98AG31]EGG13170.1 secreted protein [Melampsora larici-populina 98AG31]
MLFSYSIIGCAILAPSVLLVASSPSPQTSSGTSSMNSMGSSMSTNGSPRAASNGGVLATADGGHNNASHSGAHHSDAHLPIPIAGWAILSGFAGLSTLFL